MADVIETLVGWLQAAYNDPLVYVLLVFAYAVAVAIVLPLPIEAALILPLFFGQWGYLAGITIALAVGKTFGAWLIFLLGVRVEGTIRFWSTRFKFAETVVNKAKAFVSKTSYTGLYILLSIPLMSDTIPLYLYSLFNEEGRALRRDMYLIANFLAALNRVAILVVLYKVGVDLLTPT